VVSQHVKRRQDVVYKCLWLVGGVWCVVLEAFLFWVYDLREVCGGCLFYIGFFLVNSLTDLLPRSSPMIAQRPPFALRSSLCSSTKVLLFGLVRIFAVYLRPHGMCVMLRGTSIWCIMLAWSHVSCYICTHGLPVLS